MPDLRDKLHQLMHDTLVDEAVHHDWTYHEVRPMPVPSAWHDGQKVQGDCSKGVQYLSRWAGCPDPMKMHYGPYGNSTTLAAVLQHLDHASELLVGDLVTFGPYGTAHAAMVYERGNNPLLWSFGHQGAPNTYRLSQDRRAHQLLRNPIPVFVPTPVDRLHAKTGYWAWLQWYLGEGDWAHYPSRAKNVRPHVPLVISPQWWLRERQFIANRHNGNPPTTKPGS
jgi:hypothetical protein